MTDYSKRYLYRMTHIENVPHILQFGITHQHSAYANPAFTPIGDSSLITTRDNKTLDNGKPLGAYIPFYFGARTPMLYVIQKGFNGIVPTKAEEIVYCVSSVEKILDTGLDFVFTDGHAVDSFTTQYTPKDISKVDFLIDWDAVKARDWKKETDLDLKRRKQAEFLVLGDLPYDVVLGFIVYNDLAKNKLLEVGVPANQIHIDPKVYF
jgi:hypothetical protein